jgi:hypothetical protein
MRAEHTAKVLADPEATARKLQLISAGIENDIVRSVGALASELVDDLGQLEPNGPTRFPLADGGAVDRVAIGCHIVDAKRNEVAAA